ncbi:hypothetical protein M378DRAFT_10084 [Amanita muscaria Koide BX008]|uniref:Uncharacterized protein n=1 Tax=Amanita muscaria (strain Koide BX008) TaxID=946122 RepID=A0A0C2WX43_AMAMK|nr:hypothetical protein M378DRAFT_10084 [Amanita muscaria Koide BX008]
MVSQLMMLETPSVTDSSKPRHSGPKPNALKDSPEEEPIPPLPAPVKGYPTPWITQYDVLTYVYPLYTRGWGQSLKPWKPPPPKTRPGNGKGSKAGEEEEKKNEERERYTMLFSAKYKFKDYDSVVEFFLKLVKVAKAENHHPSVIIANGSPFTVTVTTQTDSARRPTWVEEEQPQPRQHPPQPASSESSKPSPGESELIPAGTVSPPISTRAPYKIPGLTIRDVRLAILTETVYTTHFASHLSCLGRHIHPANFRLSWDSMERIWKRQVLLPGAETGRRERREKWLEERVRRKRERNKAKNKSRLKCYACNGNHHVNDCTKRAEIKPQSHCPYCKEFHWSIDCPVRAAKHINQEQLEQ